MRPSVIVASARAPGKGLDGRSLLSAVTGSTELGFLGEIGLDQLGAFGHVLSEAGQEVVEDAHVIIVRKEAARYRGADEARAPVTSARTTVNGSGP